MPRTQTRPAAHRRASTSRSRNRHVASLRYRATEPLLSPQILSNIQRVLDERYLSPGAWVSAFERRWAEVCGVRHAIATSSGTAALHVAFRALSLGPGDEVIVPAMTCPDTLHAATFVGARPVIVDIEPERYGMDPRRVEAAITPRTKAIVPVHLYGCPVLPEIVAIGRRRGLLVVEDAAEAHGANSGGRRTGALGDAGCFSFRGDKVLGIGTGGMITTNDDALARRAHYMLGMASPGGFDRYLSTELGLSYEMSNVHAAIGVAQIDMLGPTLEAKRRIAAWYDERLSEDEFDKPALIPGHVWWRYSVLLKRGDTRAVHARLLRAGIETMPPFAPMYRIPMYRTGYDPAEFPVAEDAYQRLLSLPISPYLRRSDIEFIIDELRRAMRASRSSRARVVA